MCRMTGDGVNDTPTLKMAYIGIAVSDIVFTQPGLIVIINVVLTSRALHKVEEKQDITKKIKTILNYEVFVIGAQTSIKEVPMATS